MLTGAIIADQLSVDLVTALKSLSTCDQIVLGWTGSSNLNEVAKWLKAQVDDVSTVKVFSLGPVSDFALTRNQVLEKIADGLVFFIDSDEELAEKQQLPDCVSHFPANTVGLVKRQDIFHGQVLKYGETGQMYLPRLLPAAARFERPVHETIEGNWPTQQLPLIIHHYSHPSITQFLQKIARYSSQEAEYRVKTGRSFSALELLVFPIVKFLHNYVWKRGFLDGWRGVVYAVMMSLHSIEVRVFLYEKSHS